MIDQYRAILVDMTFNPPAMCDLARAGWVAGLDAADIAVATKGPGIGSHLVRREISNLAPTRNWSRSTPEYLGARRDALQTAIRRFEAIEN